MEWLKWISEVKVDIKDFLGILVSLLSIWASTNKRVRKIAKWIWSKTMGPIIDKLTGRTKTNHLINSLIESNANFQAQNLIALNDLSQKVVQLQDQHTVIFNEVKSIKSEIETNGGSTLKDGSNLTNALLWTILNEKDDGMVLQTDKYGNVIKCNRLFRTTTGRSTNEVVGTGWLNCIAPKDRERVWTELSAAIKAGRDYEGKYSIVDIHENEYPVTTRATRLTDQKGNIIGYLRTLKLKEDEN